MINSQNDHYTYQGLNSSQIRLLTYSKCDSFISREIAKSDIDGTIWDCWFACIYFTYQLEQQYFDILKVHLRYSLIFFSSEFHYEFQDRLCQEAKGNLQQKLEEFGNDYFYSLGLNKKFCHGIEGFMKNNSMQSNFRNGWLIFLPK